MARLYNDKRQGNHQVFSLVAVDESKIGGTDTVTLGLFDNKELAQQQAKASADKAYEMLKVMNSMFDNTTVELIDRGFGSYCVEVNKGICKEWHTIFAESYQANEMEYQIEDLL